MSEKALLRLRLRETLNNLPAPLQFAASATLRRLLLALPVFQHSQVIALFHPTATEPDLLPFLNHPTKTFLFPLCHPDRSLTWHRSDHLRTWRRSRFGILEPDPTLDPPVPASCLNLVLVPGLAFTKGGDRLGHGAGYYDRFLASLSSPIPTIGLAFSCQILPTLPCEFHDIPVGQVLHA